MIQGLTHRIHTHTLVPFSVPSMAPRLRSAGREEETFLSDDEESASDVSSDDEDFMLVFENLTRAKLRNSMSSLMLILSCWHGKG